MRLAYSFEDSGHPQHVHRGLSDEDGQSRLQEVVREWNDVWRNSRPVLQVYDDGSRLHFYDTRHCASQRSWTAGEVESDVVRLCDAAQTPATLHSQLIARRGPAVSNDEFESAIATLVESKVLLSLNGKLLALGVQCHNLASGTLAA